MLEIAQLRWAGHVVRMDNDRIPKQICFSELSDGKRKSGGQLLRYKDLLKVRLKQNGISPLTWMAEATNRDLWRSQIHTSVRAKQSEKSKKAVAKRAAQKRNPPQMGPNSVACPECGKLCASKFGLMSHSRVHKRARDAN